MVVSEPAKTDENKVLDKITERSFGNDGIDFLHSLFNDFTEEAMHRKTPVVLFGTGAIGKELCQVLQLHGVHPAFFCDNNPSQIGQEHFGVSVISFAELEQNHQNCLIVVATSKFAFEIETQLLGCGFQREKIISIAPILSPELLGYYQNCGWYTNNPKHALSLADLQHDQDKLSEAYALFDDQRSRDIFVARLSLFTSQVDFTGFSKYIREFSELNEEKRSTFPFYVSPEDYGYFNNDVVRLREGEILVDGGAYNGLSAATFAKTCEDKSLTYAGIYCFEPGSGNFTVLRQNTSHLHDTHCIQRGLWSCQTTLTFLSTKECDPAAFLECCSSTDIEACAYRVEIPTTSIDEQFFDQEITFIKMDVEGAETEAIIGAAKTIRRCKPKLAISAYHKHSDIYKLPILIKSLNNDYKFYIRHFGYTLFDMVLFAIPSSHNQP